MNFLRGFLLAFLFVCGLTFQGAAQNYEVTSAANSGAGTLRDAIFQVNIGNYSSISFNIPAPYIIKPTSAFDYISTSVTIDASAISGYPDNRIILDGSDAPAGSIGLEFEQGTSSVNGLVIQNWGTAISGTEFTATDNRILNNQTGIQCASCNVINNVIGNNSQIGINASSLDLVIKSNYIYDNTDYGIKILSAENFTVENNSVINNGKGILCDVVWNGLIIGNHISGNSTEGLFISWVSSGFKVKVVSNKIGTDVNGLMSQPNGTFGIRLYRNEGTVEVGSLIPGEANIISGNGSDGLSIYQSNAIVSGNFIGTNNNSFNLGNLGSGISVTPDYELREVNINNNVIGFNLNGIAYARHSATNDIIESNNIGISIEGNNIGNLSSGIYIGNCNNLNINNNQIGFNSENGCVLSKNIHFLGNFIGIRSNGTPAPNGLNGVLIGSGSGNTIGGIEEGGGNLIAYNGLNGISISGPDFTTNSVSNILSGNHIFNNAQKAIELHYGGLEGNNGKLPPDINGYIISGNSYLITGIGNIGDKIQLFSSNGPQNALTYVNEGDVQPDGTFSIPVTELTGFVATATEGSNTSELSEYKTFCGTVVTNTADSGPGSLREAIECANSDPDHSYITFNIPETLKNNADGYEIFITSAPLPDIIHPLDIDGATITGFPISRVIINGSLTTPGTNGFSFNTTSSNIKGLLIKNFNTGVYGSEFTATDNRILNNTIGVSCDDCSIVDNVIGNNTGYGISDISVNKNLLTIQGNYIGVDRDFTPLPNGEGIYLSYEPDNVHATINILNNYINKNTGFGINLYKQSVNTFIRDNFVGSNEDGLDLGNGAGGIKLELCTDNSVIDGNSIRFNDQNGILFSQGFLASEISNNIITDNFWQGISISFGSNAGNQVFDWENQGEFMSINNNILSNNDLNGILISNSKVIIKGNKIGVNQTGNSPAGNGQNGISTSSSYLIIGGDEPSDANIISSNLADGVNDYNSDLILKHNYIGTNESGALLGNGGDGIDYVMTVVLSYAIENNIIGNNIGDGLKIHASAAGSISNNRIGVSQNNTNIGNHGKGISVVWFGQYDGSHHIISGNVVGFNVQDGIMLKQFAEFKGNYIGVTPTNVQAPNGGNGITVSGVNNSSNIIGGIISGEENIIAYNTLDGVSISGPDFTSGSYNNILSGNHIFENGEKAIELHYGGVHGNNGKLPPDINGYMVSGNSFLITGAGIAGDKIQLFSSDGPQNALTYVNEGDVQPDGTFSIAVSELTGFVATATEGSNTSELSDFKSFCSGTVVTTTADFGPGSLRSAIECANADPDRSVITFAITEQPNLGSRYQITLASALPYIIYPTEIDARTQLGYSNLPVVSLNGSSLPNASALIFANGNIPVENSAVYGLEFFNFHKSELSFPNQDQQIFYLYENIIYAGSNFYFGHNHLDNCSISSSAPGSASTNIISVEGNNINIFSNQFGIYNNQFSTSVVQTSVNSSIVYVAGSNITIGGESITDGNRFGNILSQFAIEAKFVSDGSISYIRNNTIGKEGSSINSSGIYIYSENQNQVSSDVKYFVQNNTIYGCSNRGLIIRQIDEPCLIGGVYGMEGNVIGECGSINLMLDETSNVRVYGNIVKNGLDYGILITDIDNSTGNFIGSADNNHRNYIYNNSRIGVYIVNQNNSIHAANYVKGNYIGVDENGSILGNGENGVNINANNQVLGGLGENEGNIIAGGSIWSLINIRERVTNSIIQGNSIYSGQSHGIRIDSYAHNIIIKGNYIGTDRLFNDLGNAEDGIFISASSAHTIGGDDLQRNYIINNNRNGITLSNSSENVLIDNNIIGKSGKHGLSLQDSHTKNNTLIRNFIGTNENLENLGNHEYGIWITSTNNSIGSVSYTDANTIGYNGADGINVMFGDKNEILGNIYGNNLDFNINLNLNGYARGNDKKQAPSLSREAPSSNAEAVSELTLRGTSEFPDDIIEFYYKDENGFWHPFHSQSFGAVEWTYIVPSQYFSCSRDNYFAATSTSVNGGTNQSTGNAVDPNNTSEFSMVVEVLNDLVVRSTDDYNTNGDHPGILRRAVECANSNPDHSIISFNIPGTGPHEIKLKGTLTYLKEIVTIDGTTQPGYDPITKNSAVRISSDATLLNYGIGFSGASTGSDIKGLYFYNFNAGIFVNGSRNITIRDNIINRISNESATGYSPAISFYQTKDCKVFGNIIGTDISGAVLDAPDNANNNVGVYIYSVGGNANSNNIGAIGDGNTFANQNYGVVLNAASTNKVYSTTISGNYYIDTESANILFQNSHENYGKAPPFVASSNVQKISGTSSLAGDIIEVYKSDSDGIQAPVLVGITVTQPDNSWALERLGFIDPNLGIQPTDIFIATATDPNNNSTSPFSTPCNQANFTYDATCVGTPTVFTNTSTGMEDANTTYKWFINDQEVASMPGTGNADFTHTFAQGEYDVKLQVIRGECISEHSEHIALLPPPVFSAGDDQVVCQGAPADLGATPGFASYAWSPADNLYDASNNLNASIPSPTAKGLTETTDFTVTATSVSGCVVSDEVSIYVAGNARLLNKEFAFPNSGKTHLIEEIEDGTIIAYTDNDEFKLLKLDDAGTVQWVKKAFVPSVTKVTVSSGNIWVISKTRHSSTLELFKFNFDGEFVAAKTFTTPDVWDFSSQIFPSRYGGVYITASSSLFKIKDDFSIEKENTYNINIDDVKEGSNGAVFLAGSHSSGYMQVHSIVVKTNADGSIVWNKGYGTYPYGTQIHVVLNENGNILLVDDFNPSVNLTLLDSNGNFINSLTYNTEQKPADFSVVLNHNNDFFLRACIDINNLLDGTYNPAFLTFDGEDLTTTNEGLYSNVLVGPYDQIYTNSKTSFSKTTINPHLNLLLSTDKNNVGRILSYDGNGVGCSGNEKFNFNFYPFFTSENIQSYPITSIVTNHVSATATSAALVEDAALVPMIDNCTKSCECTFPVTIAAPQTTYICQGTGHTRILSASVSEPGNYKYTWSTGETTQQITVSTPGEYSVFVENLDEPCSGFAKTNVTEVALPVTTFDVTNSCYGEPVQLSNITPAQPGYTYHWDFDGVQILNTRTPEYQFSQPGTHTVMLTVSAGIPATSANGLGANVQSNGDFMTPTKHVCGFNSWGQPYFVFGLNNWKWSTSTANCSIIPFDYVSSGSFIYTAASGIKTYDILTIGKQYQIAFDIFEIPAGQALSLRSPSTNTNIFPDYGQPAVFTTTGRKYVKVTATEAAIAFYASAAGIKIDNVTIQEVLPIPHGSCYFSVINQVEIYPVPKVSEITTVAESCPAHPSLPNTAGSMDGSVTFSIYSTAGISQYYYTVNGVEVGPVAAGTYTVDNLTAGNYNLTVRNEDTTKSCTKTFNFTIGDGSPDFEKVCATNVSCLPEAQNGSIAIQVNRSRPNDTGGYQATLERFGNTITWSGQFNIDSDLVIPGLSQGNYQVYVRAYDNNCKRIYGTKTIATPSISAVLANDVHNDRTYYTCGDPNSTVDVEVRADIGVETCPSEAQVTGCSYTLTNKTTGAVLSGTTDGVARSFTFTGIGLGSYSAAVTFNLRGSPSGCHSVVDFEVLPSGIQALDIVSDPATCTLTGTLEAYVHGGLSPYTYTWEKDGVDLGVNDYKVTGLDQGTYHLKVVDARGCALETEEVFELPDALSINEPELLRDICGATVTVTGGKSPYNFTWFQERQITVNEVVSITNNRPANPFNDPLIPDHFEEDDYEHEIVTVPVIHTVQDVYFQEKSESGISSPSNTSGNYLKPGTYKVTVTDANGCLVTSLPFTLQGPTTPRTYELCMEWSTPDPFNDPQPEDPTISITSLNTIGATQMKQQMEQKMEECIRTKTEELTVNLEQMCGDPDNLGDTLSLSYTVKYHHYTLYYYDRAGSLVRTVPPAGVTTFTSRDPNRECDPVDEHGMITRYDYNSLGQLVKQSTPDGGTTNFIYDNQGALRFSQNDKQRDEGGATASTDRYSYTKYDYLGRIVEVGESEVADNGFNGLQSNAWNFSYPESNTQQETYTAYSDKAGWVSYFGKDQRYLRNRVSYSYTKNFNGEKAYTYYSYDPHGNVEWLVQDVPGLGKNYIEYDYDLISNKVLKVRYNENLSDRFFHRYNYDEDNRLLSVETSKDNFIWDKDAGYSYYAFGPLRHQFLGEDKLQKLDYVYTISGWIKGINSVTLSSNGLEGTDKEYLKDEFGMALGYYAGDFVRTGHHFNTSGNFMLNNPNGLYNGNISSWVTAIDKEASDGGPLTSAFLYRYDRLNRLKKSDYMIGTSILDQGMITGVNYAASTGFASTYSYDGNGNLLSLTRAKGDGVMIDQLSYHYNFLQDGNKCNWNNKLLYVDDAQGKVLTDPLSSDLDDQEGCNLVEGTECNYDYDKIGNLIKDNAEGIANIKWTVHGKIAEVIPTEISGKAHIRYTYDATGNRIRKQVNTIPYLNGVLNWEEKNVLTTYYVRDASGNTMAVYSRDLGDADANGYYDARFTVNEQPVYGSDRLGQFESNQLVAQKKVKESDLGAVYDVQPDHFERITENKNQVGTSVATDQIFVDGANGEEEYPADKTLIYTISPDGTGSYATTDANEFLGKVNGSAAVAEEVDGTTQFYAVAAENYWGAENKLLIYDKDNLLMAGSENLSADGKSQPVIVKVPGESEKWYVISKGINGKLYAHTLDLAAPGYGTTEAPKGEVTEAMAELDEEGKTNYGRTLRVVEDHAKGKAYVFATRFTASETDPEIGTTELVKFTLEKNAEILHTPKVLKSVTSSDVHGEAGLSIAPDGRKLAYYNMKEPGHFNYHQAELIQLPLDYDFDMIDEPEIMPTDVLPVTSVTRANSSLEYSADGRYLLNTVHTIAQTDIAGTNTFTWANGKDNFSDVDRAYVNVVGLSRLFAEEVAMSSTDAVTWNHYESNEVGELAAGPVRAITYPITLTGVLSPLPHKIYPYTQLSEQLLTRTIAQKRYELKDHLGNVRVVISDRRSAELNVGLLSNRATVLSYSNYYPFGMMMGERSMSNGYRYGFNGKENDQETGWQDYGMRSYNPKLARFISVDPIAVKYPMLTPYQFASNSPISGIDQDGLEFENATARLKAQIYGYDALEIKRVDDGWGKVESQLYTLKTMGTSHDFTKLRETMLRSPQTITNNFYATYAPVQMADPNTLSPGDEIGISIEMGVVPVTMDIFVRVMDVQSSENSFKMTFATLEGHTDAGYITFSGSYNPETDEITFSIFNETRENHGAAYVTFTGRAAQQDQWEDVMGNARKFLDKGKSEVKMTENIKTHEYDESQPMGKGEIVKEKTEDIDE